MEELFFQVLKNHYGTCVFHGHHLGFDRNANGASRSANPEIHGTKYEVDWMTRLGDIATQHFPKRRPAAILDFGR